MYIKSFRLFENINNNLISSFSDRLSTINIIIFGDIGDNMKLYMYGKYIGTIRFYIDSGWVIIDNIEILKDIRGKNIGFNIYESLYLSSKDNGFDGLSSSLYSLEVSQKRNKLVTKILDRLIFKYGGKKLDVSQWCDLDDGDMDFYDYFINGSNRIDVFVV